MDCYSFAYIDRFVENDRNLPNVLRFTSPRTHHLSEVALPKPSALVDFAGAARPCEAVERSSQGAFGAWGLHQNPSAKSHVACGR